MDGITLLAELLEAGSLVGGSLLGAHHLKKGEKLAATGAIIVVICAALAFSYSVTVS